MLFRRSAAAPDPAPPAEEASDDALDTLAAVLRTLGRYAFDLDQLDADAVQRACEGWAAHLLVGVPPPQRPAAPDPRRDWAGVRQFVLEQRRREQQYVPRALGDLRQAVWAFAEGLQAVLGHDQVADRQALEHLHHLREVVHTRSAEEIKRDVLQTVSMLTDMAEQRQERQRAELAELGARLSKLGSELQEARRESVIDPLTQLYNRRAFDDYVGKLACLRDVFAQPVCLLLVDVDHFKAVNDTHGHPAGDAALQALADCLARTFLRRSDFVARYGGEEFAVLLPETTLPQALPLAERLLVAVRDLPIPWKDQELHLTVSVGLAEAVGGETAAVWLDRADAALYAAKSGGRDRLMAAVPD